VAFGYVLFSFYVLHHSELLSTRSKSLHTQESRLKLWASRHSSVLTIANPHLDIRTPFVLVIMLPNYSVLANVFRKSRPSPLTPIRWFRIIKGHLMSRPTPPTISLYCC